MWYSLESKIGARYWIKHGFDNQLDTLGSGQNDRHFAEEKLYENCCILIIISLRFISKVPNNNNRALVEIMALPQAIIWTNGCQIYWHIYASLGVNETKTNNYHHLLKIFPQFTLSDFSSIILNVIT